MAWSKQTKTIVWVSVGIVVLIILIILFTGTAKAQDVPKNLSKEPSDTGEDTSTKASAVTATETFPLKFGKRGKEVEQAQMYLLKNFGAKFPNYGIDGVWKKETEDNMVTFLKKNTISKEYYYKTGMDKIKTSIFK